MSIARQHRVSRRQVFKWVGASAFSVLGAYVVGCGGPAPAPDAGKAAPGAAPAPAGGGRINVLLSVMGDAKIEQPVVKDLVEMFNKSQSKVVIENKPFPEGGSAKAVAMMQAGDAPDITRTDDDESYFITTSGFLHDLTDRVKQDLKGNDYFPFFFHELAADGKLSCIAMCDSVWLWMYNKKLFADAGLTAPKSWADAWDWDTTVANFRKLAKKKGDLTEVYAGEVGHGEEMPYQAGVGHYNHDMTKANFDHPLVVEAMRITAELQYKEQIALPPGGGNRVDLFNAGQLASMNQVQTWTASINPEIDFDFMPVNKQKVYSYGAPYARSFVMPKSGPSKNPDAVWEFFKWYLTNEEAQARAVHGAWGIPPLKKAASKAVPDASWAKGRNYQVVIEGLDYAYPRSQAPFTDAMAKYWKGGKQRDDVMLGQMSPEEFCKQAQETVQTEIDKAIKAGWKYVPPPNAGTDDAKSVWKKWYYEGAVRDDDPRLKAVKKGDPAL